MDSYMVGRTLGVGTYGVVRVAEHVKSGRRFAAKFVSKTMTPASLEREVQHQALLGHPNIVGLKEVISSPRTVIIMDFVSGIDLFDHIVSQSRLPEAEARRIFQQLVGALKHCHARGVCHRDVKPENILLDEHQNVKLAGFSLSARFVPGEPLRDAVGSPNYVAPEVIKRLCAYDGRACDVWSAGVVLNVMLVGELPFEGDDHHRLFRKICAGRYRTPGFLSGSAKNLIARMLTVDPQERITVQGVCRHDWFRADLPPELARTLVPEVGVGPSRAGGPNQAGTAGATSAPVLQLCAGARGPQVHAWRPRGGSGPGALLTEPPAVAAA